MNDVHTLEKSAGSAARSSGMTDLQAFVAAPGRAEMVAEVRRMIDDLGID